MNVRGARIILSLFLISGILFFASFYFGLGQYFLIKQQISGLVGINRDIAEREF